MDARPFVCAACSGKKVAVIDEDQGIIELIASGLSAHGCHVVSSVNGTDGMEKCLSQNPDLIIADINVPGRDGRLFVAQITRAKETAHIPLIPSGSKDALGSIFTIEGINDYIQKPFSMDLLIRKVEKRLKSQKKKILVVDDSAESVSLIEEVLKNRSYDVIKAANGFEGLEAAKREKPDLIILDVMLPKLNGYQVCRMLKFDAKYKDIPVLLLTARAQEEDKTLADQAGADMYAIKPFSGDSLLRALKELLWD